MSEICESLINDYIAGTLDVSDLEQGLESIFVAMPNGHSEAQSYLQVLYTNDTIDSDFPGHFQSKHSVDLKK